VRRAWTNVVVAGALLGVGALSAWTLAVATGTRTSPTSTTAVAPSVITAPVEERILEETFAVRGSVLEQNVEVVSAPDLGEITGVVTGLPLAEGDRVEAGNVVVSISDRPVIVLEGKIPMYRPLGLGDSGPDVARLQQALADLGLYTGAIDGRFGRLTEKAVRDLYRQAGYPPPTVPSADDEPGPAAPTLRIPVGELVFMSELPTTVAAVHVSLGDGVSSGDSVIGLGSGSALIVAEVPVDRVALLSAGTQATIFSEVLQTGAEGRVISVSETVRVSDQGIRIREVTLEPAGEIPSEMFGVDVAVTFTVTLSDVPVVTVPITAVHALPDGRVFVTRVDADGGSSEVEVTVGAVIGGWAEITSGDIAVGDRVVVGSSG